MELHHIHITDFKEIAFDDFSKTDEMIVAGKRATDDYLAQPHPSLVTPARAPGAPLHTVPGARVRTAKSAVSRRTPARTEPPARAGKFGAPEALTGRALI